jgi:hypothetical protein
MLGLVSLMEKDGLAPEQLRNYMVHVKKVFWELDIFTRRLNKVSFARRFEVQCRGFMRLTRFWMIRIKKFAV